jgi:hypothetical protein
MEAGIMSTFQINSPVQGKSFSVGSVIEANGGHSLSPNSLVWAILRDIYGHYYLQNPPVMLNADGNWLAKNIHLGHDIIEIMFGQVTAKGNDEFLRKVRNQEWEAFDAFPAGAETLGSVSIQF